ncbi:MAG: DUF2059 domain-containing protein, partial [Candidatus Acidiferrales bacterium]
ACVSYAQQNRQDPPASRRDIERYLDAMHVRTMMFKTLQAMKPAMHRTLHEQSANQPSLPADFEAKTDQMVDKTLDDMPVDDLIAAMIPVYQKYLTKGDVDALVAFYSTPRGAKIMSEMPAMTADAMNASVPLIKKMVADIHAEVQQQVAQVAKRNKGTNQQN